MKPMIFLAPIHGITYYSYRNTFLRYFTGYDRVYTPFLKIVKKASTVKKQFADVLPENNRTGSVKLIPQIMTNEENEFIRMINGLQDLGYDLINWNLGCPFPMVAKKKRGSGLLPFPERIKLLLDTVLSKTNVKLSLKIRLGRYEAAEVYPLIHLFNQYPLTEIIIHPRLGIQMYKGDVDLAAFAECLTLSRHKIIYNGDIFTSSQYTELSAKFPEIDQWMIGRGALYNPFLADQIKQQDVRKADEKIRILKMFHDDYLEANRRYLSGDKHLLDKMKAFWLYLSNSFENSTELLRSIIRTKTLEHYKNLINRYFTGDAVLRVNPVVHNITLTDLFREPVNPVVTILN